MNEQERRSEQWLYGPDGHASEAALTCLADGEETLLPAAVRGHIDACDVCTQGLGAAALLSIAARELLQEKAVPRRAQSSEPAARLDQSPVAGLPRALAARGPELANAALSVVPESSAARSVRRPLPSLAIAAALLIALFASVPGWLGEAARVPQVITDVVRLLPQFVRALLMLRKAVCEGGFLPLLSWASAVVFILVGAAMAHVMPRRRTWQGGVG